MTIDALKNEALKLEMLQRIDFDKRRKAMKNGSVKPISYLEIEAKIRVKFNFLPKL
jgi:hypothetical protein